MDPSFRLRNLGLRSSDFSFSGFEQVRYVRHSVLTNFYTSYDTPAHYVVLAKRKTGTYATVSGWLKIKQKALPPILEKPLVRTRATQTSQVQRDGKAYRR